MIVFNWPKIYRKMTDTFLATSAKGPLPEETIGSNMSRLTLKRDKGSNAQSVERILAVHLTSTNIRRDVTFVFRWWRRKLIPS